MKTADKVVEEEIKSKIKSV